MNAPAPPENTESPACWDSLLRWYVAMGADAAIDAAPHDRFAPPNVLAADANLSRATAPRPTPAVETLIRQAAEIAAGARSLQELETLWTAFEGCALAGTASRMIFASGRPHSDLMIIGAAPGSDDERQGVAFAGSSGRLLDAMLRAIGLSREHAYLTNVIPWRPPGNRPPTPLEAALCLPFTRRHIALANPACILCLGERAAQVLLDTRETLAKLRGRWHAYEGEETTVSLNVTFSLDYLLAQPLQKRRAWTDLLGVAQMLEAKADAKRPP